MIFPGFCVALKQRKESFADRIAAFAPESQSTVW